MAVSSLALTDALAEVVGRDHVLGDDSGLSIHAVDEVSPRWVVWPASVDEVSRLLALAWSEGLAVVPRGRGSNLALGNPPRRLDLVLDCSRVHGITEHEPEDMVVSVRAGTTLADLAEPLSRQGQRLPLDPVSDSPRTLGGVLATNASGPLRFRYGTGRDLLLGVRFVQADGTITWGGAKVVKSVTGYDVPKLLVGSLGTLGIIVEGTLRLHPIPPVEGSWLFGFTASAAAGSFLAAVLNSTLQPERIALLNATALEASGLPGSRSAIAVSIGSVQEAVTSQGETLRQLSAQHDARALDLPNRFWLTLRSALAGPVVLRLSCEISRLLVWQEELERQSARCGMRPSIVGEAGNGVLRAALTGPLAPTAWQREFLAPLRAGLFAEGGGVVIERAPGPFKAGTDVWGPIPQDTLTIMHRLKHQFDPRGILSPGRFVGGI